MIESLLKENDHLQKASARFQAELVTASDYILQLEEKCHNANLNSLEILKKLRDAELENAQMRQYIVDLKTRVAIYIPVRNDPIDHQLAEYINNFPDRNRLKIMFMRESEGVYEFGTRRVAVRVDNDKINVRVGGGYLSIDEFLDQYTPLEIERIGRRDPLRRFQEKVAIQKTLVGREKNESSPVRN